MAHRAIIYKLTSPSGKSYIGQTRQELNNRLSVHSGPHSTCRAIKRAIDKYGIEPFHVSVISSVDFEDADDMEINAIKYHETLAPNGYNLAAGGKYPAMSDETRAKMSRSSLGKKKSLQARINMSKANMGKKLSPETCARISSAKRGVKQSPETLLRILARNCPKNTRQTFLPLTLAFLFLQIESLG